MKQSIRMRLVLLTALITLSQSASADSYLAQIDDSMKANGISSLEARALGEKFLAKIDLCNGEVLGPSGDQYYCKGERDRTFYGAATLISVGENNIYYVTNAHVVSEDPRQWEKLELQSKTYPCAWDASFCKPQVLAVNPGKDLALLAVSLPPREWREARDQEQLVELRSSLAPMLPAADTPLQSHFQARAALVGYRNKASRRDFSSGQGALDLIPQFPVHVKNLSVATEVRLQSLKLIKFRDEQQTIDTYKQVLSQMEAPEFWASEDCPPVFLRQCLRTRMRSWGFSGGFAVRKNTDGHYAYLGIISAYTPLTPDTYLIPIQEALREFSSVISKAERSRNTLAGGRTHTEMRVFSDDRRAKWLSPESIQLGRDVLEQPILPQFGGGHNMGGGGHNMGGGGHNMGGGGHNMGGGGEAVASFWGTLVPGLSRFFSYESGVRGTRDLQDAYLGRAVPLAPQSVGALASTSSPYGVLVQMTNSAPSTNLDSDSRVFVLPVDRPWTLRLSSSRLQLTGSDSVSVSEGAAGIDLPLSTWQSTPGLGSASGDCTVRISSQFTWNLHCHAKWIDSESEGRSQLVIVAEGQGKEAPILVSFSAEFPPFSSQALGSPLRY